jgi:glutaminyl-tRNA synthetase
MSGESRTAPTNFIRQIIDRDLETGKHARIHTRFPPEPNGYLHIGHAKSIVLNFGIAQDYPGTCNLRFDDTNPAKEEEEFVEAIKADVRWLGYDWAELRFASDYFEQLYQFAVELIRKGRAFVCDLTPEQVREYRGTLTEPGRESPYRDRSIEENLDLFARMRAGEFADGSRTLRARIDMAAPNINLRDPALYRIRHGLIHHQTGAEWCIYPMYDYTHPISDALEGITHSLCTLEFEDHRPLYDWVLDNITIDCHPRQIEFCPAQPRVHGDEQAQADPAGARETRRPAGTTRGCRPSPGCAGAATRRSRSAASAMRSASPSPRARSRWACSRTASAATWTPSRRGAWQSSIRCAGHHQLPAGPQRDPAGRQPPQGRVHGRRELQLTREVYIDRADFREEANKKYKRLVLGGEVRLRNAYVIRCDEAVKDAEGKIVELRCSYDPETLGHNPEGRKVRGVIHWVSAVHGVPAEVRLYDRLFNIPDPGRSGDFLDDINPDSLKVLAGCVVEPALASATPEERFQFEREGYFCLDSVDSHVGPAGVQPHRLAA